MINKIGEQWLRMTNGYTAILIHYIKVTFMNTKSIFAQDYTLKLCALMFCLASTAVFSGDTYTELETISVWDTAEPPYSIDSIDSITENSTDWSVQSIDLVTADEIEKINADRIEDFADAIPGLLIGRNEAGIASNVYIRGFSLGGRLHLNGLRDSQRFYLRDPATLDRVEIIKGLNSVLLGSGSPGGAVNLVTKKPSYKKEIQMLTVGVGSPERYRVSLDMGRPVDDSGLAWRSIIALQKAETGRKNVNDDRFTFMPSLAWIDDRSSLLIEAEHNRQNRDFDFDNVFLNGEPVYDVSYTDPRTDSIRTSNRLAIQYSRELSDTWLVELNASYLKGFRDERLVGFLYLDTIENDLVGFYRKLEDDHKQYSVRAGLVHSKILGTLKHKTKMSFEINREDSSVKSAQQIDGFRLDVYHPVFDFELPDDDALTDNSIDLTDKEQAAYFQHTIKSRKLFLSLGFRQSHYSSVALPTGKELRSVSNNHLSTSIGAVWQFNPQWKIFSNRTESFSPNGGRDVNDKPFDPEQGIQYEVGFRYTKHSVHNQLVAIEGSLYKIDQNNQLKRDPNNPGFRIPFGEVQVKGFELKGDIPINEKLNMSVAYSYYNSEITKTKGDNQGNRLHSIPKQSASLKLGYSISPVLKLSLIGTSVGSREGNNSNSFEIPAYTRVDAGIQWAINKRLGFNLGVRNLTNKNYVATGGAEDFLVMGRDRTITGNLSYQF